MPQFTFEYPDKLRELADATILPGSVYDALYDAARNFESMMRALEAANPDLGPDDVVVAIRFAVPNAENFSPGGPATVSVSAGANVDPANTLVLLGAHDAIVACARETSGIDLEDEEETSH